MVMQIPSNMILTRVRPSLYLPFWAAVWSCISAATGAVHTYGEIIAVRILLGVAEAPFFPGVFYLLSCWYTREELGLRMAILYSGLVVATAFSGLIAAGVFAGLDDVRGLDGWRVRSSPFVNYSPSCRPRGVWSRTSQAFTGFSIPSPPRKAENDFCQTDESQIILQWLYIIEGAISFVFAIVAVILMPDFPESTTGSQKWLLSAEERKVAVQRIQLDRVVQESNRSVWFGFRLAALDYRTWAFVSVMPSHH